jgi:signal transduction histidine kinase
MKSVRRYVMIGAVLWTMGLLAVWAVIITLHREAFQAVAVVHGYPHTLMMSAILAMVAGFAIVRRGLAPLDTMRRRLAAVRAGAAHRVDGRFPTEVQPLVSDLNALLDHQEKAVSRAQAKAGDLAHGLKTPLTILSHEAERAAAAGHADLAAAMNEQIERMRRQIEYHLAHARAAAAGATPGARCSIAESAEALARTMRRLHAEREVAIELQVDPAHEVRCERADLDEMLGNLLDNACKWARARIVVRSALAGGTAAGRAIAITVDDDGPGIDPSMRGAVLQRGVRADEAAPGSGFGLAIVRDLAELYGGDLSLHSAPLGGVSARLTLPAAANTTTPQVPTPN